MLIFFGGLLIYGIIASLTGGYIHAAKRDNYDWECGISWPLVWLWYGFFKPIAKVGMLLFTLQHKWMENWRIKRMIRSQLRKVRQDISSAQHLQERLRVAEKKLHLEQATQEVEALLSDETYIPEVGHHTSA